MVLLDDFIETLGIAQEHFLHSSVQKSTHVFTPPPLQQRKSKHVWCGANRQVEFATLFKNFSGQK
jgi:hypothetical protein